MEPKTPKTPSRNTVDPDLIPRGDLEIIDRLGEGGFGTVYKGFWNGVVCAIKMVSIAAIHQVDQDTLCEEARVQSSLRHPNIVPCFGIRYENEDIWMVMDLIDGCDLGTLVCDDEWVSNSFEALPKINH